MLTRHPKMIRWLAGVLGALVILSLMVAFMLPVLLNQERIKARIQNALSTGLGGEIRFSRLELSLFPPQAVVNDLKIATPYLNGTIDAFHATIRFLPLLKGATQIKEIGVRRPQITVAWSADSTRRSQKEPLVRVRDNLSALLLWTKEKIPGATVILENGTAELIEDGATIIQIENASARLEFAPQQLIMQARATADSWESMALSGTLSDGGRQGRLRLDWTGLQPQPLLSRLGWAGGAEPQRVDIQIDIQTDDFSVLQGSLHGRAMYDRMPFPLEIPTADFRYKEKAISVTGLAARFGRSTLSEVGGQFDLDKSGNLHIRSAVAVLDLDQLYPVIADMAWTKKLVQVYRPTSGTVAISEMQLKGPLLRPRQWAATGKCSVENLVMTSDKWPSSLQLRRGEFAGDLQKVQLDLIGLDWLDVSLAAVGSIENWMKREAQVELLLQGPVGERTIQWAAEKIKWPASVQSAPAGVLQLSAFKVSGPIFRPVDLVLRGTVAVDRLMVQLTYLPGPVTIQEGLLQVSPEKIVVHPTQVTMLDASLNLSGDFNGGYRNLGGLQLNGTGSIGMQTLDWLESRPFLSVLMLDLKEPLSVSSGRFSWRNKKEWTLAAEMNLPNGPQVALEIRRDAQRLTIERLSVVDDASQATMTWRSQDQVYDLEFIGNLSQDTVRKIIKEPTGWINGDFAAHIAAQAPLDSTLTGSLRAGGPAFDRNLPDTLKLQQINVRAMGSKIKIISADIEYQQSTIALSGDVEWSAAGVLLDLQAQTGDFSYAASATDGSRENQSPGMGPSSTDGDPAPLWNRLSIQGTVGLKADSFRYGQWEWKPLDAIVNIDKRRISIKLTQGSLCGMQSGATFNTVSGSMPVGVQADAETLSCFLESSMISGDLDFEGEIATRNRSGGFLENLQGGFRLTAEDGRIFRMGLLAKIFAVVNITEILKGQAPDLFGQGYGYNQLNVNGAIENGVLTLNDTYINGKSVNMAFTGSVDVAGKKIDITALVTPLKTIDSILERIPYVSRILGKHFMAVPVDIKGDLSDPAVIPAPPSDVAMGLLGILQRTVTLPIYILQPFAPEEDPSEKDQ